MGPRHSTWPEIQLLRTAFAILVILSSTLTADPPSAPRVVRVPVRIQADAPVPDAKAFRATIDRQDALITRVLTPSDPQMILIVLDLAGDLGAIEAAKEALTAAIEKLPPTTYVGLLRAQDGLSVLADPAQSRKPAIAAIRDLASNSRPGLLEALEPVEHLADSIARVSQVRVAILFVTDSNVSEYREDFTNPVINSSDPHDLSRRVPETLIQEKMSKVQRLLAVHETPLSVVHLAYRSDRLNEAYQNGLKQLTETLVGSSEFCRSLSEIPEAIDKALAAIVTEYTLLIAVPQHLPNGLQIQVSAGDLPLVFRNRLEQKEK